MPSDDGSAAGARDSSPFVKKVLEAWGGTAPRVAGAPKHRQTETLEPRLLERLSVHFEELARWQRFTSLVAARELAAVEARHYAESLAALRLVSSPPSVLVDLGSGQGFPGLVLAAAWPDVDVFLVEPRAKKVAFLRQTALHMELKNVRVVDERLDLHSRWFPADAGVVTLRALHLSASLWCWLRDTLPPSAAVLRWETSEQERPPADWVEAGQLALPGARDRRITRYQVRRESS